MKNAFVLQSRTLDQNGLEQMEKKEQNGKVSINLVTPWASDHAMNLRAVDTLCC